MREVVRVGFNVESTDAGRAFLREVQHLAVASRVDLEEFKTQETMVETPYRPVITWRPDPASGAQVPVFELDDLRRNAKASMPNRGPHCVTALEKVLKLGRWPAWRDDAMPLLSSVHRVLVEDEERGEYYDSALRADKVGDLVVMFDTGELLLAGATKKSSRAYIDQVAAHVQSADLVPPATERL